MKLLIDFVERSVETLVGPVRVPTVRCWLAEDDGVPRVELPEVNKLCLPGSRHLRTLGYLMLALQQYRILGYPCDVQVCFAYGKLTFPREDCRLLTGAIIDSTARCIDGLALVAGKVAPCRSGAAMVQRVLTVGLQQEEVTR